ERRGVHLVALAVVGDVHAPFGRDADVVGLGEVVDLAVAVVVDAVGRPGGDDDVGETAADGEVVRARVVRVEGEFCHGVLRARRGRVAGCGHDGRRLDLV